MPFGASTAGSVCPISSEPLPNSPAVWVWLAAVPTRVSTWLIRLPADAVMPKAVAAAIIIILNAVISMVGFVVMAFGFAKRSLPGKVK